MIIKNDKKSTISDIAKSRQERRERDNELVAGIFRYIEHKGGTLNFRFKKYAGDEYKEYRLVDGERYKLPRMVARHLNKDVHYTKYKTLDKNFADGIQGGVSSQSSRFEDGTRKRSQHMNVEEKIHRCEFRSLEFMDDDLDLIPASISMVTSTI